MHSIMEFLGFPFEAAWQLWRWFRLGLHHTCENQGIGTTLRPGTARVRLDCIFTANSSTLFACQTFQRAKLDIMYFLVEGVAFMVNNDGISLRNWYS